jgi:hypothetical protein
LKRNKEIKPISFRVYPDGRFFYCEVNIWPNKASLHKHGPPGRNYEACCGGRVMYIVPPKREKKPARKTGLFAEANFHRRALGVEVVSHEFTHAAFALAERKRLDLNSAIGDHNWSDDKEVLNQDGVEEIFCYAVGKMVRQFTQKLYDLRLYREIVTSKLK